MDAGEMYVNIPPEISENESINDDPIGQEKMEDIKKDQTEVSVDEAAQKTVKNLPEEVAPSDSERQLLEERQIQAILEAEKMKEAEMKSLLHQYDLTKFVNEEYTYIGYVKKGEPLCREHFGICTYNNGDCYVGQWANNMKQGLGKYTFKNGNVCCGEFINDIQDGYADYYKGAMTWSGVMKEFKILGCVIGTKDNEIFFEGSIESANKRASGFGKLIEKENVYSGELQDLYKNGWGIQVKKDRYIYKGVLEKNIKNGYGEIYYSDGTRFFGFYKNNLKHGFGLEFQKDKAVLSRFEDDYKNGFSIVVQKGTIKLELWHLGFRSKVIEKFETPQTKQFLKYSYPEFIWALQINFKRLIDTFSSVIDNEAIAPPQEKEKEQTEPAKK